MKAKIPVARPRITCVVAPDTLEGLGVGQGVITVGMTPDAGPPMRAVAVNMSRGKADSTEVHVSGSRQVQVHFRSAGLRNMTVKLTNPSLDTVRSGITLTFPFGFFGAALIGGGLGSLLGRLTRPNKSHKALIRHFSAGVIVGLIGAGLFLLGVNVTAAKIAFQNNELAIAVVSALVALGGVGLLTKLSTGVQAALEDKKAA
jgi:hypothetical protein